MKKRYFLSIKLSKKYNKPFIISVEGESDDDSLEKCPDHREITEEEMYHLYMLHELKR